MKKEGPGRHLALLPDCDVPEVLPSKEWTRETAPHLPQVSETEISRHYTQLALRTRGVNGGFYPLGSCTMKYNPKVNEEAAALPGFQELHPLQPVHTVQGALKVLFQAGKLLDEITAMDQMTFQPGSRSPRGIYGPASHQGVALKRRDEGAGRSLNLIRPTAPIRPAPLCAAWEVVSIPSAADGCVDLEALKAAMGPDVAGLMLTNPIPWAF